MHGIVLFSLLISHMIVSVTAEKPPAPPTPTSASVEVRAAVPPVAPPCLYAGMFTKKLTKTGPLVTFWSVFS